MKTVCKTAAGYGNVGIVEKEIPRIAPDEVLVKIWAAGVCGSDLLIQEDKHFYKAPVVIGHEFSGVVEKAGPEVRHVAPGDHVVANIETRRGWLGVSTDGAYAPYIAVPEAQIYVYPNTVSLDDACFTEPVVATIHCMQERNNVRAGDDVLIVGPGPMGLLGVQFAKLRGARSVTLIGLRQDEKRLRIGKAVGADHILYSEDDPQEAFMEITHGKGADFVLECSASERGVQHAIDCARKSPEGRGGNGVISFISLWGAPITIKADPVSLYQLDINGCWSWNGRESWERAVDLITRRVFNLGALLTSRYTLEEWETAFAALRSKQDVKAFIHPNGTDWRP